MWGRWATSRSQGKGQRVKLLFLIFLPILKQLNQLKFWWILWLFLNKTCMPALIFYFLLQYCFEDLLNIVQGSEVEIKESLKKLKACQIEGQSLLIWWWIWNIFWVKTLLDNEKKNTLQLLLWNVVNANEIMI